MSETAMFNVVGKSDLSNLVCETYAVIHLEYNTAQLYISVFDRAFSPNASWSMLSNKSTVLNNNGGKGEEKAIKQNYSEEV